MHYLAEESRFCKKQSLFLNEQCQLFIVGKNNHELTEVKEFKTTTTEKAKKWLLTIAIIGQKGKPLSLHFPDVNVK